MPTAAHDAFGRTYARAVTSERLPVPAAARTVEAIRRDRSIDGIASAVESLRSIAATPRSRIVRRFAFVGLRVYVRETKRGKAERVNVKIPIPLPLIGGLIPPGLSRTNALRALAIAQSSDDAATALSDYLDSVMGFELVRVEDRKGPDQHSVVVIGFD